MVGADRLRIGLKEGDLPESAKRDVPAAVEYYSASTSTSALSSDVTLNYLKCKDFCKFDKSSPPTCLPNCYVIDGQIQLDAPLLLIPPPATVTTSETSIDTSMTTFQTLTTSAVPVDTLLASRDPIEERAPPGLVIDHRPPRKCTFGKKSKFRKPGCVGERDVCYFKELLCYRDISENSLNKREDVPGRFSTTTFASPFIPENLCIVHLTRLSHVEFANTIIPTDAIPKALTDRTNIPAINTAAFRKLEGDTLAAITVEAAKKVGNKAAGHSENAPNKIVKRTIEERALDASQNISKGHPKEDMFDKEKKDRRGDGLDTSREISSSDADTNPLNNRSNTLPPHKCGSAICLLRRAFDSLTSKRYAPP
ncbi:MAG: hypothetical protein Q9198_007354, partial [Flavoplaca austrocitrina]